MSKFLNIKSLAQLQDYAHNRYFVKLSPGDTYADLFVPTFWAYHRAKLSDGRDRSVDKDGRDDPRRGPDTVRVRAHDGSFDVMLTVVEVKADGVVMQRFPVEPSAEALAQAAEIGGVERYVPYGNDGRPVVRTQFTEATKWRVLGLQGEVASSLKDEAAATKAMADYLKGIHYAMPDAADQAKHLDAHTKLAAAEEARQQAKRERAQRR